MTERMQSVELYIPALLKLHGCVAIPGFGGFVLNEQSAKIISGTTLLSPPTTQIGFNRSLSKNDGLLQTTIAIFENISLESSLKYVQEIAQQWKEQLTRQSELQLNGLGVFKKTDNDKWSFYPVLAPSFLNKYYGLSEIALTAHKVEEENTLKAEVAPIIGLKPIEAKQPRKKVRYLIAALTTGISVAALLVMAIILGNNKKPSETHQDYASVIGLEIKKEAPKATVKEFTAIINDKELAPERVAVEHEMKFYVIGGSFSTERNAKKLVSELNTKGYNAQVLHNETGFYRVAYLSEQDSMKADQHLKELKLKENKSAWLLKW